MKREELIRLVAALVEASPEADRIRAAMLGLQIIRTAADIERQGKIE